VAQVRKIINEQRWVTRHPDPMAPASWCSVSDHRRVSCASPERGETLPRHRALGVATDSLDAQGATTGELGARTSDEEMMPSPVNARPQSRFADGVGHQGRRTATARDARQGSNTPRAARDHRERFTLVSREDAASWDFEVECTVAPTEGVAERPRQKVGTVGTSLPCEEFERRHTSIRH